MWYEREVCMVETIPDLIVVAPTSLSVSSGPWVEENGGRWRSTRWRWELKEDSHLTSRLNGRNGWYDDAVLRRRRCSQLQWVGWDLVRIGRQYWPLWTPFQAWFDCSLMMSGITVRSGDGAGVVGLQKPPRHRTKGAAPQGNPDGQLCPPPWLLERWLWSRIGIGVSAEITMVAA